MAYKIIIALGLVAVAQAAVLRTTAPIALAPAPALAKPEIIDSNPQYTYSYDVQDTISGDSKGHVEERDGDVVRGEYSLIDADGFKRTVTYTADSINGFNAVVRREPILAAVAADVETAPVVVKSPLIRTSVAAPVAVSAPYVKAAPLAVVPSAPVLRTAAIATPLRYTAVRNL